MVSELFVGFMRNSPLVWQQFVGCGLNSDQTIVTIITISKPKQMTMEEVEQCMVNISLRGKLTMQCGMGSDCRFVMTRLSQLKAHFRASHINKFELVTQLEPGVYNIYQAKEQLGLIQSPRHSVAHQSTPTISNHDLDNDEVVEEVRDLAEEQLQKMINRSSRVKETLAVNERVMLWDGNGPKCSRCILGAAEKHRRHKYCNTTLYLRPSNHLIEVGVRKDNQFCRIGVISRDIERTPSGHFRLCGEQWDG